MPRGSRPSVVALTRLGARRASEIVMLTLRTLQATPEGLGRLSTNHRFEWGNGFEGIVSVAIARLAEEKPQVVEL
jgi:hypothetical protein